MKYKKVHFLAFLSSGLFLFLDQTIKYFYFHHQTFSWYIVKPWIGLEYFENPGVAFGIPIPNGVTLFYTPLVLLAILLFIFKKNVSPKVFFALALLFCGALSNFIDRIFFTFTLDYIRVITSVLNIADIMIVVGALLLVLDGLKQNKLSLKL